MANLSLALLHHPVYNKHRQVVTTAFTNLDIHDIARTARTYGLHRYYLVTPSVEQQQLLQRIISHWEQGWGAGYNPDRREALSIVRVVPDLEHAQADLKSPHGTRPVSVATGAARRPGSIGFSRLRAMLDADPARQHLLVLGTGWGLADRVFAETDWTLEPIEGAGDYNHLPVRAAAAIMLDRLTRTTDTNAT